MNPSVFFAHGKLLLTAEYFVLDGALALALPVKLGQRLITSHHSENKNLLWKSIDEQGQTWYEAIFDPVDLSCAHNTDEAITNRLQRIFMEIKKIKPALALTNCQFRTELDFSRNWGLGTSSTLIYLMAKWADIDPFDLQFKIFGGSGYDIACAGADGPILYQLKNGSPVFASCNFAPPFSEQLYFIFLGKKQNSRSGIAVYNRKKGNGDKKNDLIEKISLLTNYFLAAKNLFEFEKLIEEHECILRDYIGLERAKDIFFKNYWGEIKSLGAWGGDFVLATSDRPREETQKYFNDKGFKVFLPYKDLKLNT